VFERRSNAHVVYRQPTNHHEVAKARAALAACPVAAIRVETLPERRHRAATTDEKINVDNAWSEADEWLVQRMSPKGDKQRTMRPFPRPFLLDELAPTDASVPNVYWMGHHNEASFGAVPYLLQIRHQNRPVWIMVDTPKYSATAVNDVLSVTGESSGPEYLFLTHVDDTADHGKWAERFPGLKQIFHAGDLGRHNWIGDHTLEDVEILLPTPTSTMASPQLDTLTAYTLDGTVLDHGWQGPFERGELDSDAVVLHTPGHSPGSITLYVRRMAPNQPGILFTGDTYAYTTSSGGRMTGFGRYGNQRRQQVETLEKLSKLTAWDIVAPGHGHPRDYRGHDNDTKLQELKVAQEDLLKMYR
jgi:glyoxylase-like metal-dependent hydrolase (beta-lactamase superfamily II)